MIFKSLLLHLLVVVLSLSTVQTAHAQRRSNPITAPQAIPVLPTAEGPERSAAAIFAAVSPAVAYIETPSQSGSGVLVEHGYLLTNAHVVAPYEHVRVVFPDGSEHLEAPVFAMDYMADLALVGPIETDIEPVALTDGSGIEIGRDVYMIGYPLEVERFPQPTITAGILSRVRTWDTLDLSLFQADATTTGGQSGGIMVTYQGDVVGISTFYWDGFAMATSVADALPRLDAMLDPKFRTTLGRRALDWSLRTTQHEGTLTDSWDEETYLLNVPAGEEVEIAVDGLGLPYFSVVDQYGTTIVDSRPEGETQEIGRFTVLDAIPHYIQVIQYSDNENDYALTASHPLIPMADPDDGDTLRRGRGLIGSLDTPVDYDTYNIYLNANESVEIRVDSLGLDTTLMLYFTASDQEALVVADPDGGVFGHNGRLVYRAPSSGVQRLWVAHNGDSTQTGGYFLTVDSADRKAEPSLVAWQRDLIDTRVGSMAVYVSPEHDFEMIYPAIWQVDEETCEPETATLCAAFAANSLTVIEEEIAVRLPPAEELARYVDYVLDYYAFNAPGYELISRRAITTTQGLPAARFVFRTDAGQAMGSGFVYLDAANQAVYDAVYFMPTEEYAWMEPLIEASFASFRAWDGRDRAQDAIHHLDQGVRAYTAGNPFAARNALDKAIDLDPQLADAYRERAYVHYVLDDVESVVADMDRAIALQGPLPTLYGDKAWLLYLSEEYDQAKTAIDKAIRLDSRNPEHYALRAKIATMQGGYDRARFDLDLAYQFSVGESPVDRAETLAFLYLMTEAWEAAAVEYDALYVEDWRSPHVLLGRALAVAALRNDSDDEEIRGLLDEGIEAALAYGSESDPQLALLYALALEERWPAESGR